jgi:hypothetical protein
MFYNKTTTMKDIIIRDADSRRTKDIDIGFGGERPKDFEGL